MIYSDALKKLVSTLASEGWSASAISHHLDLELGFVVRHLELELKLDDSLLIGLKEAALRLDLG